MLLHSSLQGVLQCRVPHAPQHHSLDTADLSCASATIPEPGQPSPLLKHVGLWCNNSSACLISTYAGAAAPHPRWTAPLQAACAGLTAQTTWQLLLRANPSRPGRPHPCACLSGACQGLNPRPQRLLQRHATCAGTMIRSDHKRLSRCLLDCGAQAARAVTL